MLLVKYISDSDVWTMFVPIYIRHSAGIIKLLTKVCTLGHFNARTSLRSILFETCTTWL